MTAVAGVAGIPQTGPGRATRLAFFVAGFALAAWAPLVPYAQARLGVDEGALGLLLLCLGMGSVISMPLAGVLSARIGARPIVVVCGFGLALLLPWLAILATPVALGAALFVFGFVLGGLEVAMNIHAVDVEKQAGRPLMSGFHAMFSVGGFAGALIMTGLLSKGLAAVPATLCCAPLLAVITWIARPGLLRGSRAAADEPLFVVPRGIVRLLALLALIGFLAEGAVLDWGGLLLIGADLMAPASSGFGYVAFSIAMTLGRLCGDTLTARFGDRTMVCGGGVVVVAGFMLVLVAPFAWLALAGFGLVGLGAANIVPVFFRRAGNQGVMPAELAVAAISTAGYAGVLLGPALLGFIAHAWSLHGAFWLLALVFTAIPLLAGRATRG